MKINVNHPTFVMFMDNMISNIKLHIPVETYFVLSKDKKSKIQYSVFKLIKNAVKTESELTNDNFKNFLSILCKKNEESENYEFASILNDLIKNFDSVNDITKSMSENTKTSRVSRQTNIKKNQ